MFFVARPQHPQHPQAMFRTTAADVPYSHYPYSPSHLSSYYGADEGYLEAQYAARLRARQRDEMMRQRARAAAVRAQQRREYEHELAIRAAEEEAYRRYVGRVRAQEAIMRQAEARRLAEAEHARRVAASRAKTAAFQRLIRTMLAETIAEQLASKAQKTTAEPSLPVPTQALPGPSMKEEKNVEKLLQDRAKTESDGEVLVTLNGLLQALASAPTAATSAPTATSSTTEATTASASSTVQSEPQPSTPSTPVHSRKPSFETLDRLSSTFSELTKTFTLPTADFSRPSTPARPDSPTTHLAFTPANRPIHEYEAALGKLLAELDAVESDGDAEVRERRRELVKSVEAALAALDGAIEAQRLAREVSPATEVEEVQHANADDAEEVAVVATNTRTDSVTPLVDDEVLAPAPVHIQNLGHEAVPAMGMTHEDADHPQNHDSVDAARCSSSLADTVADTVASSAYASHESLPLTQVADVTTHIDNIDSLHVDLSPIQSERHTLPHDVGTVSSLAGLVVPPTDPSTSTSYAPSSSSSPLPSSLTLLDHAALPRDKEPVSEDSEQAAVDAASGETNVLLAPQELSSYAESDEEALLVDDSNSHGEWSEFNA